MGYSKELRERVVAYHNAGNSIEKTRGVFKVGTTTISKWKKLLSDTGSLDKKELNRKQRTANATKISERRLTLKVYDWTTKRVWFEVWFEWHLCPLLRVNSVIIMDNASWRRKSALESIAKFYGFPIIWLPTYSPDKNRIEHLWANLKSWLQYNAKHYNPLQEAISHFFHSHQLQNEKKIYYIARFPVNRQ